MSGARLACYVRRIASALRVTVHDKLDEIPEWNAVAAVGGFYSTAEWLRMFPTPHERYLAVRRGDDVLAVAPCSLARDATQLTFSSNPARLLGATPPTSYPVVFVGPTWGFTNRLLVAEHVDAALRAEVVAALLGEARAFGRREGAALVAFGYLPTRETQELLAVDDRLIAVPTEIDHQIGPIASWDDYLALMPSKQRLKNVHADIRRFAEENYRVDRRGLREVCDPMCELLAMHEAKYGYSFADALREMQEHFQRWFETGLDERAHVFCGWKGDQLHAIALYVSDATTYYARAWASHRDASVRAALYFNVLFYEPVRVATAAGARMIHLGRSKASAKVQHGARGRMLWFVLDSITAWTAAEHAAVAQAARDRLDGELAEMRVLDEETVRADLELATTEALIARIAQPSTV